MSTDDQIRALYDGFQRDFNKGAIDELVRDFFVADAVVTGHMAPVIRGREGISALYRTVQEAFRDVKIESIETRELSSEVSYNLAHTHMINRTDGTPGKMISLCIFRKTPQGLKCEVDFFAQAAAT